MPLLEIATAQPSFSGNSLFPVIRSQSVCHGCTFIFGNESSTIRLGSRSSWRQFPIPDRRFGGGLIVKAVATMEPRCSFPKNENLNLSASQSSTDGEVEVDEKEHLRRMRISKANSGKKPWNYGRKHSAETLERIREKTKLAMQNPKVRMKLKTLGHAQSEETRMKIGDGVRMRWQRRREKRTIQENCLYDWENLIAEASRKGLFGDEELQWNSYEILDEQLEREWQESVEQRRTSRVVSSGGSKRAPKSPEQRRKIAEAIAAKWADPEYRERVHSGLSRYHGSKVGSEKPRRKAPSDKQPRKIKKAQPVVRGLISQKERRRNRRPTFKDPLASSKLEMLKTIRSQRAATECTKIEAITRAKLLIAEAEKAAEALERAATVSDVALASLIETRKLIAEAIESIGSIDTKYLHTRKTGESPSFTSLEPVNHAESESDELEGPTDRSHEDINGFRTIESSDGESMDFDFSKIKLQDLLDSSDEDDLQTSFYDPGFINGKAQPHLSGSSDFEFSKLEMEHMINHASFPTQAGNSGPNGTDQSESVLPNRVESQEVGYVEPNGIDQLESMLPPPHQAISEAEKEEMQLNRAISEAEKEDMQLNRAISEAEKEEMQLNRPKKTKKWVRGKLVELGGE